MTRTPDKLFIRLMAKRYGRKKAKRILEAGAAKIWDYEEWGSDGSETAAEVWTAMEAERRKRK